MGWKWNDIAAQVDELVAAKKTELEDKLLSLATEAQQEASKEPDAVKASFLRGKAHAYSDVREAVKH